jgi:SAM-dependent methyltransferase
MKHARVPLPSNYQKHQSKNPIQRFLIGRFYDALVQCARNIQPKKILDVGCGEGFTLSKLQSAGIGTSYVGIDPSKTALSLGKKQFPALDLRLGSAYRLPWKDGSFDLVCCNEVLEHLTDPGKALTELHRVSKKYVLLSVPHEPFFMLSNFFRGKDVLRFGNNIEHINHWSKTGFVTFVRSHGFRVAAVGTPFPWILVLAEKTV